MFGQNGLLLKKDWLIEIGTFECNIIVYLHSSVSSNNEKICRELFELSVLESVSSRKNISGPRHVK